MLIDRYGEPGEQISKEPVIALYKDAVNEGFGVNSPAEWLKIWTDRPDICTQALRIKINAHNIKIITI